MAPTDCPVEHSSPAIHNAHNQEPRPFVWKADPDEIIAAVIRGHQVLESIH
ncbi:hypothetical protein GOB92_31730 [Sinorhizobium meliloti]|nr:hypothetical protein [Sinorhizobium meliloti]